jgi:ABC-type uncharacterized transport system ATPase subunit
LGEIVDFIGPNAAVKITTLMRLAGMLYPTSGHEEVMGSLSFRREKVFFKNITLVTWERNRLF